MNTLPKGILKVAPPELRGVLRVLSSDKADPYSLLASIMTKEGLWDSPFWGVLLKVRDEEYESGTGFWRNLNLALAEYTRKPACDVILSHFNVSHPLDLVHKYGAHIEGTPINAYFPWEYDTNLGTVLTAIILSPQFRMFDLISDAVILLVDRYHRQHTLNHYFTVTKDKTLIPSTTYQTKKHLLSTHTLPLTYTRVEVQHMWGREPNFMQSLAKIRHPDTYEILYTENAFRAEDTQKVMNWVYERLIVDCDVRFNVQPTLSGPELVMEVSSLRALRYLPHEYR